MTFEPFLITFLDGYAILTYLAKKSETISNYLFTKNHFLDITNGKLQKKKSCLLMFNLTNYVFFTKFTALISKKDIFFRKKLLLFEEKNCII